MDTQGESSCLALLHFRDAQIGRSLAVLVASLPTFDAFLTSIFISIIDWNIPAGVPVQQVVNNFNGIIGNASTLATGFVVLAHDLYQQTVDLAVQYVLPLALSHSPKLTIQPIVTCLKKPLSEAYIETSQNRSSNAVIGTTQSLATVYATSTVGVAVAAQSTSRSSGSSTFEVVASGLLAVVGGAVALVL